MSTLLYLFSVITTELRAILSAWEIGAQYELHFTLVFTDTIQAIKNPHINRTTPSRRDYSLLHREKQFKCRHLLDSRTSIPWSVHSGRCSRQKWKLNIFIITHPRATQRLHRTYVLKGYIGNGSDTGNSNLQPCSQGCLNKHLQVRTHCNF